MNALKAHVKNGRIIVDEPTDLPEGTELYLVPAEGDDEMDDEERAELEAAIDEGLADVDANDVSDSATTSHRSSSGVNIVITKRCQKPNSTASKPSGTKTATRRPPASRTSSRRSEEYLCNTPKLAKVHGVPARSVIAAEVLVPKTKVNCTSG